jgi:hypothetical protein
LYGYTSLELLNMPADIRNFFGGKPQSATPIRPKKEEKKKNSKLFRNIRRENAKTNNYQKPARSLKTVMMMMNQCMHFHPPQSTNTERFVQSKKSDTKKSCA